jgi:hypothetical protein
MAESGEYAGKVKFVIMDTDEWDGLCDEDEHSVSQMHVPNSFESEQLFCLKRDQVLPLDDHFLP